MNQDDCRKINHPSKHGLVTPNEGINQRNLKFWVRFARQLLLNKNMCSAVFIYLGLRSNFRRAVKVIFSLGIRNPCL